MRRVWKTGYDAVVQLIRLIVFVVAGAVGVAGYFYEGRRLQVIRQLSGEKARSYYEAGRTRDERMLIVFTVALALAAVATFVRDIVLSAPVAGAA
ncbi:MAG: hypothetical protein H7X95_03405 [Deltaproteobacteria bacterium]|nr:hypothetical protein [Deltaproteobacteria bacterium]